MSNLGRPMLTIVGDFFGRHDTLTGACAAQSNQVRYALDKRYMHNCRDNFLAAMASWRTSLDKRDLSANVNFFLHAPVTAEGALTFSESLASGQSVPSDFDSSLVWSSTDNRPLRRPPSKQKKFQLKFHIPRSI